MKLYRVLGFIITLFSLASANCGQTRQKADGAPGGQPRIVWSYDTGG